MLGRLQDISAQLTKSSHFTTISGIAQSIGAMMPDQSTSRQSELGNVLSESKTGRPTKQAYLRAVKEVPGWAWQR